MSTRPHPEGDGLGRAMLGALADAGAGKEDDEMTRATGILADRAIAALFDQGRLKSEAKLDVDQIQPASLDLRLGSKAFRVRASFMPGPSHLVADKLDRLKLHVIDLSEGRPASAEEDRILLTPTLVQHRPLPRTWVVGDLEDTTLVEDLLDHSGVERRQ